jgi:hypothetical protein
MSIQSWCQRVDIRCHPAETARKKKSNDEKCKCQQCKRGGQDGENELPCVRRLKSTCIVRARGDAMAKLMVTKK